MVFILPMYLKMYSDVQDEPPRSFIGEMNLSSWTL